MRAVVWEGKQSIRVHEVPDPEILNRSDAIVKVTLTAICSSDLHLYNGVMPTMHTGDILGHEFMGEVVEVGAEVKNLSKGDWVVVPFAISCGRCFFCRRDLWSLCDNTNPNAWIADAAYGYSAAGLFGYSHMFGGYPGGQAEYVRVPFADVGPLKIYEPISDEQALFLSDIFPTGYMAADHCQIKEGDTVAVWGSGPVGLFAMKSAFLLGAERVIAVDRLAGRLMRAQESGAEPINCSEVDVLEAIKDLTGGLGPDACIDAVGMESHSATAISVVDCVKRALTEEGGRSHPLHEAILACRKGGTVSVPGVYGGVMDRFPIGAVFNKGLTLRMGQAHVHKYMPLLLEKIRRGDIDPSFVISHRFPLDEAPDAYRMFRDNADECIKVVMKP
jgi:threonine dehydrogenase-like Zn-dependent dehydrogenase